MGDAVQYHLRHRALPGFAFAGGFVPHGLREAFLRAGVGEACACGEKRFGRRANIDQRAQRPSGTHTGLAAEPHNRPPHPRDARRHPKAGEPDIQSKPTPGQVNGTSQMYGSAAACERGMASVATNGSTTRVVDVG